MHVEPLHQHARSVTMNTGDVPAAVLPGQRREELISRWLACGKRPRLAGRWQTARRRRLERPADLRRTVANIDCDQRAVAHAVSCLWAASRASAWRTS